MKNSKKKSKSKSIADVVVREADMDSTTELPTDVQEKRSKYHNLAKYRMVTQDDDDSTFSTSRS